MTNAIRIDKWLWFARFFKSRSLAAKVVQGSKVRINGSVVSKASTTIRVGDALTFPQGKTIRVVRIVALGTRRGPAPEAQALYDDLTPAPVKADAVEKAISESGRRARGSGRPTKSDRRAIDRLRDV